MWWILRYIQKRVVAQIGPPRKADPARKPRGGSGHYLYAFQYQDGGTDSLFKVGKTCNLDQRLRAYRTLIPDGKWFYTIECIDMHYSEKILHGLLKQRGYHVQREIFRGKPSVVRSLMSLVQQIDRLTVQKIDAPLPDALTSSLKRIKVNGS